MVYNINHMGQEGFKTEVPEEKGEETKKEGEYNLPEIKELEKPLILVLEKLKANIEAGVYDVLLSDDKGGRIPTLAIREIMNRVNQEAGRDKVSVYFLSGGQGLSRSDEAGKETKRYIEEKIKNEVKRKALVITEFVSSGVSAEILAGILKKAGVAFDIAALVCGREDLELGEGYEFFSGITPENARENSWGREFLEVDPPKIYHADISGVAKKENLPHPSIDERLKKPAQVELRAVMRDPRAFKKKRQAREELREKVNKAREDVKTLAKNAEKALGW